MPSDTVGRFLTNPVDTAVTIVDILKFVKGKFPLKVLMQEDNAHNVSHVS